MSDSESRAVRVRRWLAHKGLLLLLIHGFIFASFAGKVTLWKLLSSHIDNTQTCELLAGAIALLAVLLLTWLCMKLMPGREHPDLSLNPAGKQGRPWGVLWGFAVGGALFTLVWLLARFAGGVSDTWRAISTPALALWFGGVLLAVLLNAAWEEYTFRGWIFSIAVKATRGHVVAIIMGIAFGILHLVQPDTGFVSTLSVALAGIFLSYCMLASRAISVVIGIHTGWNAFQSLLGSSKLWMHDRSANELLSGGAFGLEASVSGILVTGFAAAAACWWYVKTQERS